MKRLGSEFILKDERERELLFTYRKYLMKEGEVSLHDVIKQTIESPCSRFWVTSTTASIVIRHMMNGDKLKDMRQTKRAMYQEIFRRFKSLQEDNPDWTIPELVSVVIKQPAPCFYLTIGTAIVYINRIKNSKKWKKKLRPSRLS